LREGGANDANEMTVEGLPIPLDSLLGMDLSFRQQKGLARRKREREERTL
jgi:hypothetical protein